MGNLSNLYISQSFQSLIHLGNDGTASAALTELQDGFGNGIKISVNNVGDLKLDGALSASTITALNQSTASLNQSTASLNAFTASQINLNATYATTGSNNFVGDQTITGSLVVTGEITANKLNVIIESSSVIFSSGSNIFGDAPSDTQTLNGTVYSNGNLYVTAEMSASTISGIGNATIYSASVASRLNNIQFSTSSLNNFSSSTNLYTASIGLYTASLNTFTASLVGTNAFTASIKETNTFTASANLRLNSLETFSSSTNARLNSIEIVTASLAGTNEFTASIKQTNTFTASIAGTNTFTASIAGTNAFTASIAGTNAFTASIRNTNTFTSSIAGTNAFTASQLLLNARYATTGSNTFVGTEIITGSLKITGSAYGNIISTSIVSSTASIDMVAGNFFELTLADNTNTHIRPTNIASGETANLLITQGTNGTVSFSPEVKFPSNLPYVPSVTAGAKDILTFVTFNSTTAVYASSVKSLG